MSIRFQCRCGKSLKAREESAGKRTKCPQCGEPVGIPSLAPTHRGVKALPETVTSSRSQQFPTRKLRTPQADPSTNCGSSNPSLPHRKRRPISGSERRSRTDVALSNRGQAPEQIQIRKRRLPKWERLCGPRGRRTGLTEIGSPEPAFSFIGFVAVSTAAFSVILRLYPLAVQQGWLVWPNGPVVIGASLVLLASIGYFCHCAGQILNNAVRGAREDYIFEVRLEDTFTTFGSWLALFVAGPILPVAIALDYWIRCGTPSPFDWLVLAGLSMIAAGYWASLGISITVFPGIRGLEPRRVLSVFERSGNGGIVGTILLVVSLMAFFKTVAVAAAWIHGDDIKGYFLLGCGFLLGPLSAVLILRRFGEDYRRAAALTAPAPSNGPKFESVPMR